MFKNVIFTLLVGNLLNLGPEEVNCKKAPGIFSRRALVREYTVHKPKSHAETKMPTTNNISPEKYLFPVLKLSIRAPTPSRRERGIFDFWKPKLFEVDKVTAFTILERLEMDNQATINKLKKLKNPTEGQAEEVEWAQQNMVKLSGIKKKMSWLDKINKYFDKFVIGVDYYQKNSSYNLPNDYREKWPTWLPWMRKEPIIDIDEKGFQAVVSEFPQLFEHELDKAKLANKDPPYVEEEYEECPKSCPREAEMVCAKCKEGIYRTFVSVCHVRMFNCKHPDEKVRLVARRPCVMSAPYNKENLEDVIVAPKNELVGDDPIERHVWCQTHGRIDDPRCQDTWPTAVKFRIFPPDMWKTIFAQVTWPERPYKKH